MAGNEQTNMREPIAVIGMGCRFAGGASTPGRFWDLLVQGRCAVTEVPEDRWDTRMFYDPGEGRPGKTGTKRAAFLTEDYRRFDPLFFGISPMECHGLDPQQRLLLEVTWEALENAGIPRHILAGSRTGVFVGAFSMDSQMLFGNESNRELLDRHSAFAGSATMLSNRLSHWLDLRGPSMTIDTACSSSLVAVHYACESLWSGESATAIAGGANAMLLPFPFIMMSQGGFISRQGRSRPFDAEADGYGRGEGCGVVVLKRFEDALEAGDPVIALIRATGINHDGRTMGVALPNPEAQQSLIREVARRAGVRPSEIQYIEAHGTGTQAGDVTEAHVLHEVLAEGRPPGSVCLVGSVKANIGHLEAGAGVAGLIKTCLCLHRREIPPQAGFREPNPAIPLEEMCLRIPTQRTPWPETSDRPLAGVNSFGYGGTNAHAILEAAPSKRGPERPTHGKLTPPVLIPVSARGPKALRDLAGRYASFLMEHAEGRSASLEDLLYTLSLRRSHFEHRLALVVSSRTDLAMRLSAFARGDVQDAIHTGRASFDTKGKTAFVFSGMGPHWWGMGRELFHRESVFRSTAEAVDAVFTERAGWSLMNELQAGEDRSRISRTDVAQPMGFLLQVALTELLRSWGIVPDCVVGHSVGEIPAAYAAGALDLEDALAVVYHRSRLQAETAGRGTMLAVQCTQEQVRGLIERFQGVSTGAVNSPSSLTLTGDRASLEAAAEQLGRDGLFHRFLRVDVAYHSPQMMPVQAALTACLSRIRPLESRIPLISTVTGDRIAGSELDGAYWGRNALEPVRFQAAVETMAREGMALFLEIGPHPVLGGAVLETLHRAGRTGTVLPTLKRDEPEPDRMRHLLGDLYTLGLDLNWAAFLPGGHACLPLPNYPWERETHWEETGRSVESRRGTGDTAFLHTPAHTPEPSWRVELSPRFFPFLEDHSVDHMAVFPAAGYVEAGLAVHLRVFGHAQCNLEDLRFERVLSYDEKAVQQLAVSWDAHTRSYAVHSRAGMDREPWVRHACGLIRTEYMKPASPADPNALRERMTEKIPGKAVYEKLEAAGLTYGDSFRTVKRVWKGKAEALVEIHGTKPLSEETPAYLMPPGVLDACFQSFAVLGVDDVEPECLVPTGIRQLRFYGSPGSACRAHIKVLAHRPGRLIGHATLFDKEGRILADVRRLEMDRIPRHATGPSPGHGMYAFQWQPAAPEARDPEGPEKAWLMVGNNAAFDPVLERCLTGKGIPFHWASPPAAGGASAAEAFSRFFRSREGRNTDTIVFLPDLERGAAPDPASARTAVLSNTTLLLDLVRTLQAVDPDHAVHLAVVTAGAEDVGPDHPQRGLAFSPSALGPLIENEAPGITCKAVDLDPGPWKNQASLLVEEIRSGDPEACVAFRGDVRYVKRLEPWHPEPLKAVTQQVSTRDRAVALDTSAPGKLENLCFRTTARLRPRAGEVEVEVHYAGLNFKDLMKLTGKLPSRIADDTLFEDRIGMEGSGVVVRTGRGVRTFRSGDAVYFLGAGLQSHITVPARFVIPKPPGWTLEQTPVFIVYATAYEALVRQARLRKGEWVLIHSAAGGLGLAALEIARHRGARIMATAGTEAKRAFLRDQGIEHVMNSRTTGFAEEVLRITDGRGVDVVLNTLDGDRLFRSVSVLAPFGRFVELGKRDIVEGGFLPMAAFNENRSFIHIDIDRMARDRASGFMNRTLKPVARLVLSGKVRPIPVRTFGTSEVSEAFRRFTHTRHVGKIALKWRDQDVTVVSDPPKGFSVRNEAAYLITGGTRGLGLEIARWLSARGAGSLVLVSRGGVSSEAGEAAVAHMAEQGTRVETPRVDVADARGMARLFQRLGRTATPLRGIFHCAMVLDDARIPDMTRDRIARVLSPKIAGAVHLHEGSAGMALDAFVMLSSVAAVVGNPGQANYVAANAFLEGFARYRRGLGLPATTVSLGAMSETGVAFEDEGLLRMMENAGMRGMKTARLLEILETALKDAPAHVCAFDLDWNAWCALHHRTARSSLFRSVLERRPASGRPDRDRAEEWAAALRDLGSEERTHRVQELLLDGLSRILKVPRSRLNVSQSIMDFGIDSLMAVELLMDIQETTGLEFSSVELLSGASIEQLAGRILGKLGLRG